MATVLVFTENVHGYSEVHDMDDCFLYAQHYYVDLALLEDFKVNYEHEYNYIKGIVEEALGQLDQAGADKPVSLRTRGRKFSFGDTPEWFRCLAPATITINDNVKRFSYDVS